MASSLAVWQERAVKWANEIELSITPAIKELQESTELTISGVVCEDF